MICVKLKKSYRENNVQLCGTVMMSILEKMKEYFGDLKIYQGKKHVIFGIGILLGDDDKIEIKMKNQMMEVIGIFGEETTSTVKYSAYHF